MALWPCPARWARGGLCLRLGSWGADFAYMGSAFIATDEARAVEGYKQMICDSTSEDIVYSSLFTGVHGNYLRGSIINAGMDPDNLAHGDPSQMSFGSKDAAKAWKDIWGCGQGHWRGQASGADRATSWPDCGLNTMRPRRPLPARKLGAALIQRCTGRQAEKPFCCFLQGLADGNDSLCARADAQGTQDGGHVVFHRFDRQVQFSSNELVGWPFRRRPAHLSGGASGPTEAGEWRRAGRRSCRWALAWGLASRNRWSWAAHRRRRT